jgi:Rrf2 family transcriptional regulator, iron-sulfur cluster assembly transcription factor
MRLSTKGRYAARIMLFLALHQDEGSSRKQAIAAAESISADYVEQILIRLKAAGLVVSRRGAKGGFALARPADTITLADILRATEGPLAVVPCAEAGCQQVAGCVTREIWREAQRALEDLFEGKTLNAMERRAREIRGTPSIAYSI